LLLFNSQPGTTLPITVVWAKYQRARGHFASLSHMYSFGSLKTQIHINKFTHYFDQFVFGHLISLIDESLINSSFMNY